MENGNTKKRRAEEEAESQEPRADKMPKPDRSPPRTRKFSNSSNNEGGGLSEATFKAYMEGVEKRFNDKVESMGGDIKKNKEDISEVRTLLVSTETNLLERMDEQKKQLEGMIRSNVSGAYNPAGRLTAKQEEAYWLHRRSLSVWPLHGDDIGVALRNFLVQKLRFTEDQIRDMGRISFKRLKEPASKARKEVMCTFDTKEARDLVKAASKNLAGEGANVGLRAQFPGFLLETFRLLEAIGYNLRAGDDTVRRSVKFDDSAMDLMMDVKLGDEWKRIRPDEARATLKANPGLRRGPEEMSSQDLSKLLSKAMSKPPLTGANATKMP